MNGLDITTIKVEYEYSNDVDVVSKWLAAADTKEIVACDFEAATRYKPDELAAYQDVVSSETATNIQKRIAESVLGATALGHPSHSQLTHFSIAWGETKGYVVVLDNHDVTRLVLQWLVTTEVKQVWANATYDFKHIYYYTREMPKDYEDVLLYVKCLFNHVDPQNAKASLKELAGTAYGAWAIAKENFELVDLYNKNKLLYAATDACATLWCWRKAIEGTTDPTPNPISTKVRYSPWDQLPQVMPKDGKFSEDHFYHNTLKWLIRDTVKLVTNGLHIDLEVVEKLEVELNEILESVNSGLANNPAIKQFLGVLHKDNIRKAKAALKAKKKTSEVWTNFTGEFKPKNAKHRSYFMHLFADKMGISKPEQVDEFGISKWSMKTVNALAASYPVLKDFSSNEALANHSLATKALQLIEKCKAIKYNEGIDKKIEELELPFPEFNPASSQQKIGLFAMYGIESEETSATTGLPSWNRGQIELVNRTTVDEDIKALTQLMIDHSFAAIVKNNFIKAFYKYSVFDENLGCRVLAGNYRLAGAKTFRYTADSPNMLNAPSSKSIFSKPVKKCFKAPKGYVVATADFSALEDRVIGNLSGDENKLSIFTDGLDGHCLSAIYYYPEVMNYLPAGLGTKDAVKEFFRLVEDGHPELKKLRSDGKGITFGLA